MADIQGSLPETRPAGIEPVAVNRLPGLGLGPRVVLHVVQEGQWNPGLSLGSPEAQCDANSLFSKSAEALKFFCKTIGCSGAYRFVPSPIC